MRTLLKLIWRSILKILRGVLFAGLYLASGLVVMIIIDIPYAQSIPIGLSAFAILATFCGLCLRLSSAITIDSDKKLALMCGEKCFTTLFLFAIFLSIKVSVDLFGNKISGGLGVALFNAIKWLSYSIVLVPMMLILFDGMKDVSKLIIIRATGWMSTGADMDAP